MGFLRSKPHSIARQSSVAGRHSRLQGESSHEPEKEASGAVPRFSVAAGGRAVCWRCGFRTRGRLPCHDRGQRCRRRCFLGHVHGFADRIGKSRLHRNPDGVRGLHAGCRRDAVGHVCHPTRGRGVWRLCRNRVRSHPAQSGPQPHCPVRRHRRKRQRRRRSERESSGNRGQQQLPRGDHGRKPRAHRARDGARWLHHHRRGRWRQRQWRRPAVLCERR